MLYINNNNYYIKIQFIYTLIKQKKLKLKLFK